MENILYEKEFKCPICGQKFNSMKVKMSKLELEQRTSDLRTVYKNFNPFYYWILVCPYCGYSATEEHMETVMPAQKKKLKDAMLTKWVERDYGGERNLKTAITTVLLGLSTAEIAGFEYYEISSITLTLARLYQEDGNEEQYKRFLTDSRDALIQVFMEGEEHMPEGMSEGILCYLIGELSRELGDKKNASTYMGMALQNEGLKEDLGMSDLMHDQWHLIREM